MRNFVSGMQACWNSIRDSRSVKGLVMVLLSLAFVVAASFDAEAVTYHVPEDAALIQFAIEWASDGDTILVADGTYTGDGNKNVDFKGKAIVLMSENGPESTIIDCEGSGRGFYFHSGEDSLSAVIGFTIKNGSTPGYSGDGGGIYCSSAFATITNCIITGNSAGGNGGGIYQDGSTPLKLRDCMITGNSASNTGGGIFCSSSFSTITNCVITGNSSRNYNGGGIYCSGASPMITDCIITENSANGGGGIYCSGASATIIDNTITRNSATESYSKSYGGGIYCSGASATIIGNTIARNTCSSTSSGYESYGGGIYCSGDAPTITGNTIANNSADNGGGISSSSPSLTVLNTIIWDNEAPNLVYASIYLGGNSKITITYSDVHHSWPGEGNINEDPLFVDPENEDYRLQPGSPCIDAGDPESPDDPDGTRADMGVFSPAVYVRSIAAPDIFAAAGSTIHLPVDISDATDIAGVEFVLTYDPNILMATSAQLTELTAAFQLADSTESGKIGISLASDMPLSGGSGALVQITLQVSSTALEGNTTSLVLKHVSLYDESGERISATRQNGRFTVGPERKLDKITISPSLAILEVGKSQQFTATGFDASGNPMATSPTWRVKPSEIGEITDGLFEAKAWGVGEVIVAQGDIADTAVVIVGILGDVTFDEQVDVRDAILCLRIWTEKHAPIPYETWAADVTADDTVNVDDAEVILMKTVERLLALKRALQGKWDIAETLMRFGRLSGVLEGVMTIPVEVQTGCKICAGGISISYDPKDLEIVQVRTWEEGPLMVANTSLRGEVRVGLISLEGIVGSDGNMLFLDVRPKTHPQDIELKFDEVALFDEDVQPIEAAVSGHLFGTSDEMTPRTFRLFQNHPNPFNAHTTIGYDLPKPARVSLCVYNVEGQLVKVLVDAVKEQGHHTVRWTGIDRQGNPVSSGVYLYRMKTYTDTGLQRYTETRKLLLIQ